LLFQDDGRKSFWSVNGPRILQVGYEDEGDPRVMEAYELIGSLVGQLSFFHKFKLLHYYSVHVMVLPCCASSHNFIRFV
jgi:hypothetical protein